MRDILTAAFETVCFYTGKSVIYTLSLGRFNPDWRDDNANSVVEAGGALALAGTAALGTLRYLS